MTEMPLTRRDFARVLAGTAASAAFLQLGRSAAIATPVAGYKAMVGIFLAGGNDGWNMVVPVDARYSAYATSRGSLVALPLASLVSLPGSTYGIHADLAPLKAIWSDGAMGVVLNTGTLYRPLTKAQYQASPDLRPLNLMNHPEEQAHWQGMRARDLNVDGFMGRLNDRAAPTSVPSLMSFAGSNLALLGKLTSPMILPASGGLIKSGAGANAADPAVFARNNAVSTFGDTSGVGTITATTGASISTAYTLAETTNGVITSTTSAVDRYFVDPATNAALTSDIAKQLQRTARMIEARSTLGHARQTFFTTQGNYDTHSAQTGGSNGKGGTQGTNFVDLGLAIAAFYNAMKALGLSENVTLFTMSDFGRTYKGNDQRGTDHAWGNNHLVIGGGLKGGMVHGTYPSPVLGGVDDITQEGRFIPTISQEEYIGAIAKWHGVADADLPYVFPNWATWSGGGRGPLGMFKA